MGNNDVFRKYVVMALVSAICYLLCQFAFSFGDFPLFQGSIGPRNFLPLAMGLVFGPFGSAGVLTGAVIAGALSGAGLHSIVSEAVGVLAMSCGGWLLWYADKRARGVALKTRRDLLRFVLISLVLSGVCAAAAFLAGMSPLPVFGSYVVWNFLLGVPIISLMTSIFCIKAVYPPWRRAPADISGEFSLKPDCITAVSDKIDELCFMKRLDRKRGFQLQSCIEECILLILSEPTCKSLRLEVSISDSISIKMEYDGKSCNPLLERFHEDMIGLTLIKQRALRARHHYSRGANHLHIVH